MKQIVLLSIVALAATAVGAQEVRVTTTVTPAGAPAGAAPMALGTGVIFGQVTEGDSNKPVAGAIVTLNVRGAQPLRVMADAQGRFGFRDLPPGGFAMNVTKPGWVDGAYGRTRPAGPTLPLQLADGEKISGVAIPIWRYATIAGSVVDESGDPMVNVPVRTLKRSTIGGQIRLTQSGQDSTDDRGNYRVGMLEPGEYIVAIPFQPATADIPFAAAGASDFVRRDVEVVVARAAAAGGGPILLNGSPLGGLPMMSAGVGEDGRPLSYTTVFYPNVAASTRATLIAVTSGEERAAVDFQLRGSNTSKVSGLATGPEGAAANLQLTLVPAEAADSATSLETFNGFSDQAGRFTIEGVPPGNYILRAVRAPRMTGAAEFQTINQGAGMIAVRTVAAGGSAPLPTEPTLWAEMPIAVGNRDRADVPVSLRPGVKLTGMLQFNGGAERPAADRLQSIGIMIEPADARPGVQPARGRVETSGQFVTMGVPPGKYFIRVTGAYPGWTFHSAMVNGRDATVVPVEIDSADIGGVMITFTDRPSELSGQVTAEGSVEASTVLVFPAEQAAWIGYGGQSRRFANVRVDKTGNFKVTNLPAGEYLAIAIPDRMANDWQNPKFLESLARDAARVRVRDGEKATASLKVAR